MIRTVRGILQLKCQQAFKYKYTFFVNILVQFEEFVSESKAINLHNMQTNTLNHSYSCREMWCGEGEEREINRSQIPQCAACQVSATSISFCPLGTICPEADYRGKTQSLSQKTPVF